jgi:hypothetical protein
MALERNSAALFKLAHYPMILPFDSKRVAVSELRDGRVTPISTLYVPPKPTKPQPDLAMLERLDIGA